MKQVIQSLCFRSPKFIKYLIVNLFKPELYQFNLFLETFSENYFNWKIDVAISKATIKCLPYD